MFNITATDTGETDDTEDLGDIWTQDEKEAIRNRSKIAELLMQRGQDAIDPYQMDSGLIVPVSALQGLDKIAASMAGAYIAKKQSKPGEFNATVSPATGGMLGSKGVTALTNSVPNTYGGLISSLPY